MKVRELDNSLNMPFMVELDNVGELKSVKDSPDGQFVAVSAMGGTVVVFLTKTVSMGVCCGNTTATLTSLRQVTIIPEGEKVRRVM